MQASRVSSRALKVIAAGSKQHARSLHMTGPATFSSLITSDRPAVTLPRDSTAAPESKRPVAEASNSGKPIRHFNTSRSLKAVGDTSTIDFAYIPDFDPDTGSAPVEFRVPILPETQTTRAIVEEVDEEVMIPTIHTVAADGTHIHAPSAMSEVTDSNSIDFQGMAQHVASRLGKPVEESASMAKQIWGSLVDDVLGPKHSRA